ncbi:UvrD-helicase domain-containing protein [Paenibacillus polymyxa]|uniref:UvrD-helicase domain-containing protein n=1 Tax=Paenibacillus polymyxa TaxID=1406 RepID=UPI00202441AB|nr:UvrD-helicase domain-containing protein [Paenibacillus polymyxa]URJ43655.3 UvrD-helicase domain-containing protein [Paenibacillus polymyxa]
MQYDNTLVLACAGSGKTYGMCNDSRSLSEKSTKKILMLSYTHKGIYSIKKEYAKQNNGVLDKNVVISTWFQFILKELIRPYQRSFLEKISQIRSFDFSRMYGANYEKKNTTSYFLNRNNDVKANRASEFALLLNKLSDGAVLKRLEETYACIYIDELQDLVGKDIELLELLFLSSIKIYCVGDYKQATLKTHNPKSDRKKGGMYVFSYLETCRDSHRINIVKNNTSKRFVSDIANFANLVYPEEPIIGALEAEEPATGVFQILQTDIHDYIQHLKPSILKYDVKTPTLGYPSLNFGVSKGMTLERVLIFPNKPLSTFLLDPSKGLKAPDKYYVGVTRAKFSLTFVVEKLKPNRYFFEDSINLGGNNIRVLKFKL